MENILRKRVRATIKNRATHDNQVVYGYYSIDLLGRVTITVFANTKSYSYKSGVNHRGRVTARVVGVNTYNSKKATIKVEVLVNNNFESYYSANEMFAQTLLAIGYCSNID